VEPELLIEAGAGGAVAGVGVALELVDFDRPLDDLEEVIAANVFHRAVALGSIAGPVAPGDAVFTINGEERARPAIPEEPRETLAFVRDLLGRLDEELAPGDLVIAGALAPAAPVAPGDVVEFRVEPVGAVALRLTD
jgi:2-keto-4-pentenoate hydratase